MANKGYEAGANFERRVKKHYEKLGYWCIRAAGSHGVADVVCLKRQPAWDPIGQPDNDWLEVILVQCKTYEGWDNHVSILKVRYQLRVRAVYAYRKGRKLILEELN